MENLLIDAVANIDENDATRHFHVLLDKNIDPRIVSNYLNLGLQQVAKRYENGDYYIADLIMAGELVTNLMQEIKLPTGEPLLNVPQGKILVGTVFDDIHDVGKNIFVSMLRSEGFRVVDLGTDVSTALFLKKVKKEKPAILGISGILTSVIENIRDVIKAIEDAGLRDDLKIILGGNIADRNYAHYLGADGYSRDAIEGVSICRKWLMEKA